MTYIIYTVVTALCIVTIYIFIPWGVKLLIRNQFLGRAKNTNSVFLTFDDGPNPDATPRILEILKEADAKATFFVLGKNVELYPDIAKNIIDNGHEIGEHSYEHLHAWKTGPLKTMRDLARGGRALQDWSLVTHGRISFRPPFGKVNLVTLLYVWLGRKKVVFWSIDPEDYDAHSAQEVANHVIKHLEGGDVILLHDGRNNRNDNIHVTTTAIELILEACKSKGLRTSSIREGIS